MSERSKKNKGIRIIKKSNQLIEARYRFDTWETRMFLSLLSCIRKEDADFQPYRIWYRDVVDIFNIKSHQSYDLLRAGVKNLMRKTLHVNYQDNGFIREKEYHIIRSTDYLKEGQSGEGIQNQEYIDVTIEPEMKPLLLQLQKNFTAYDLSNVSRLTAQSVRVYELLKQYESLGGRLLDIDYMKRILEYENEYPDFSNFHQWVIKPAVKEINKYTDIKIDRYEKVKEGRKVVALHFFFSRNTENKANNSSELRAEPKPQVVQIIPTPSVNKAELAEIVAEELPVTTNEQNHAKEKLILELSPIVVTQYGVSLKMFIALVDDYTEGGIRQALKITEKAVATGKIKASPAGFFVEAVRGKFKVVDVPEKKKETIVNPQIQEQEAKQAQLALIASENKKEKYLREEQVILALVITNQELLDNALQQIQYSMFSNSYNPLKSLSENLQNPSFKGTFYNTIKKLRPDAFDKNA
jgi:plasmid replication initiation protein